MSSRNFKKHIILDFVKKYFPESRIVGVYKLIIPKDQIKRKSKSRIILDQEYRDLKIWLKTRKQEELF